MVLAMQLHVHVYCKVFALQSGQAINNENLDWETQLQEFE